jgi:hypothetical protein
VNENAIFAGIFVVGDGREREVVIMPVFGT